MNYFATVLRQKYPDIPVTVQIAQEELTVRMTIETDDGHREVIEQTLEEYGLVIAGNMSPQAFLTDELDMMALTHKLELAQIELRHSRDLLRISDRDNKKQQKRINSLEDEVKELRYLIGNSLQHVQQETITQSQEITKLLGTLVRQISRQQHQAVAQAFETLREQLTSTTEVDEPAMTEALDTLKEQAPDVFDQLAELARGTVVGVTGNMAYAVLQRCLGI